MSTTTTVLTDGTTSTTTSHLDKFPDILAEYERVWSLGKPSSTVTRKNITGLINAELDRLNISKTQLLAILKGLNRED